jgi:hypothetical protein
MTLLVYHLLAGLSSVIFIAFATAPVVRQKPWQTPSELLGMALPKKIIRTVTLAG